MRHQTKAVPPTPTDPRLAAVLKRIREERGLSQEKFGAVIGLTGNTVGQYELGNAGPAWFTVTKVVEKLDLSLVEFAELIEAEGRQQR